MNPTEQAVDAALREAYENGFRAGREAAVRLCDEAAVLERQCSVMIAVGALRNVAIRIRALKSKEAK